MCRCVGTARGFWSEKRKMEMKRLSLIEARVSCQTLQERTRHELTEIRRLIQLPLVITHGCIVIATCSSSLLFLFQICVTKMSTHSCQGTDSVIKPLATIPEDKKVRVQRTQSDLDPFEKPTSQVKRVHSENNACINAKCSSVRKESPKLRRHSSPSSVSTQT